MKIKIWLILIVVFSLGMCLFSVKNILAIASGGLAIHPNKSEWDVNNSTTRSWFVYTLNQGETRVSKVDVKNESDKPITLKIYPVDATTTKDGSFAPMSEDSIKKGIGAWVVLPISELSLNPKEIKTVDFTINVPLNAEVCDHMGAIIVQAKDTTTVKAGTSMQVVNRLGARIYITVSGNKKEKLEIGTFDKTVSNGKVTFQLTLINKGNTRILPKGKIEINDESGMLVDKIELVQREIFPGDTIVLPIKWEKTLDGNFNVLATVEYGNQKLTKNLVLNNGQQVLGALILNQSVNKKTGNIFYLNLAMAIISAIIIGLLVVLKCFF